MSDHRTCPHCKGTLPPLTLTVKILGEKVKEPLTPRPDPEPPPPGVVVAPGRLASKRSEKIAANGGES